MDNSILRSTKKVLGIAEAYTAFDEDVIMHVNLALSNLNQLGVGPASGFTIQDDEAVWQDLAIPNAWLNLARPYVYLKTRLSFDPPGTSFHLESMRREIEQLEGRLSVYREGLVHPLPVPEPVEEEEPVWG